MLSLNIGCFKQLLIKTKAYTPPIENMKGVKYLFDKIHTPMENGTALFVRDIDFSAFTLGDIEALENYFNDTVSRHRSGNAMINHNLRQLTPVPSKTRFV